MKAHLGDGSILVEWPEKELMSSLSRFRHGDKGGEYEELFTLSRAHNTLVTLPGFAARIKSLCGPGDRVVDERRPMPEPSLEQACHDLDKAWHGLVEAAVKARGGVVSVPDILGSAEVAAAILRAFPRDALADRGTPLSVVAARDSDAARAMAADLRRFLPGREISISAGSSHADSDDIVVATYNRLSEVPRMMAGILIGDDAMDDDPKRAEAVSGIRNAVRWGIVSSPAGGCESLDLAVEGLFGPVVASATYADAVDGRIGAPITVCWLEAPKPQMPWGSAPDNVLESLAATDGKFIGMIRDILKQTPPETGCIAIGGAEVVKAMSPDIPGLHRRMPAKLRQALSDDISYGVVRRAVVSPEAAPRTFPQGVMINVTCGGRESATLRIPWRRLNEGRSYIVDFQHGWDVHNGRPGRLARNDEARTRRYAELGFSQIHVGGVTQLILMES